MRNAATAGIVGATLCVPNDWLYGRLDIESAGGMVPAYPQSRLLSFDRLMMGNAISFDGVGSPGRIEDIG